MDTLTFALHFFYIAGTFGAGVVFGYVFRDKIEEIFSKLFGKR